MVQLVVQLIVIGVVLAASTRSLRTLMRRGQSGRKVFARTTAWKQAAGAQQLARGVEIDPAALALQVRSKWAALFRTLLPADSQPAQFVERGISINRPAAVGVQIFHAHDQRSIGLSRALERRPEGARMAYVQVPGGRRRKPPAITGGRGGR